LEGHVAGKKIDGKGDKCVQCFGGKSRKKEAA